MSSLVFRSIAFSFLLFPAAAVLAQEAGPVSDPFAAGQGEEAREESELDRLSRTDDDPFSEIESNADRTPVSVTIRALNKITARFIDLEASMEEITPFGTLEIVPRYCDTRPPEEFPETTAFLQIYDVGLPGQNDTADEASDETELVDDEELAPLSQEAENLPIAEDALTAIETAINDGKTRENLFAVDELGDISDGEKIFSGWMFASSPALNAVEHPVYDIWVIDCKTVSAEQ